MVKFTYNGKPVITTWKKARGERIRQIVDCEKGWQIFLESPGDEPDRLVSDRDIIRMEGVFLYSVPPATFGAA